MSRQLLIAIGGIAGILVLGSIGENPNDSRNTSPEEIRKQKEKRERREADRKAREARECEETTMAFIMSQEFVKKRLKSPSTSEFPWAEADDVSTTYLGDCRHKVRAYVDAQNSFGAQIRTPYFATLRYDGGGQWIIESLEMVQ